MTEQLFSNILFIFEDDGIIKKGESVLSNLEKATKHLKRGVTKSEPETTLCYIENETNKNSSVKLSEIARNEKGEPLISSTIGLERVGLDIHEYALFGWKTKDGNEHSACYPHLAFYPPEDK